MNLHEFFLCDFDKSAFMNALLGLKSDFLQAKIAAFNRESLFSKDPYEVFKENFIENLGHGPERR